MPRRSRVRRGTASPVDSFAYMAAAVGHLVADARHLIDYHGEEAPPVP